MVMCLLSCLNYQRMARRLASPQLLPVAKKACGLIAANRLTLSKLLFRKRNQQLAEEIHQMPDQVCAEGCEVRAACPASDLNIPDGLI